jgi:hypothetical protein
MRELVLEEVSMVAGGYTPGDDGPSGKPKEPEDYDRDNAIFEWGTFDVTCCPLSVDAFTFNTEEAAKAWAGEGGNPYGHYENDPHYYENQSRTGSGIGGPY